MAKYVVPPRSMSREIILMCLKCKAMYVPVGKNTIYLQDGTNYEKCPICGYEHNSDGQRIPLWKYNIIKWLRGIGNSNDQIEDTDDE